jgi:hypothetical protein
MATKLVPIDAGKPGKQLDIFDEMFNRQENKKDERKPVQHPDPKNQPLKRGTFQSFRL